MLRTGIVARTIIYAILIVYMILIITPFLMIFMNSFKSLREIFLRPFSPPSRFTFENYIKAWKKANLTNAFLNSAIVSFASVAGILLVSSMLAYAISRYEFPLRRFLYIYVIAGLALPARLAIIPIYVILQKINLLDTRLGLITIYVSTGIAFATFLLKNFMDDIPVEIEESARMDGATPWTIFTKIDLPLIRPALVVVGIVNFVGIWNDFFFPLIIINSRGKETIPLAISIFFGEYSNQWQLISAALSMSVLPIMITFFILSRYFIVGMTQGAIK
ncbi:MAG: carbohydrate ABC transporter permease [Thermotoga sp.]|nr:MAG: carbohydrate ABC transporter permease [Thermotoga sp.]